MKHEIFVRIPIECGCRFRVGDDEISIHSVTVLFDIHTRSPSLIVYPQVFVPTSGRTLSLQLSELGPTILVTLSPNCLSQQTGDSSQPQQQIELELVDPTHRSILLKYLREKLNHLEKSIPEK